ncbi:MAG: HEAT repeat domain-containing protein [Sandaracinaceae bacterium]
MLIARYRAILENDPRETFAFRRLLDLYRERDGSIDAFVTSLNAELESDPEAYAPHMLLGHVLRAQNRADEATTHYTRAAALRESSAPPRIALARLARDASNPTAARRFYDEALERTRDATSTEELLREAAQLAMGQEDFDGARAYYERLRGGGERSLYLRSEFARALAAGRHWERSAAEYERVIRSLRGDNRVLPPILLELSRAQLETGEVDASIQTLDRALRLAGRQAGIRAEVYDQLLTAHRRADRLDELAERLRTEGGRGFESNELLGRIEDELGHDEEALAAYRRALRGRSRDIDTRVRIIQLLSRSGRLDEVVDEYRSLIRSAPREPRFVIELAQLLMQTDRRDEALRLLRDTGRRHARDAALHQQLAELYARWGEDELSAREVELLVRIDPRDPAHLMALGAQQFDRNDVDGAIRTWTRVVEAETDRAAGHAALAGILADHDLLLRAIESYREAVRLEPDELTYVRGLATALERHRDNEAAETQWRRVLELAADDRVARREARERIVGIWVRTRRLAAHIRGLRTRFQGAPPDPSAGRFLAEALRRSGPDHAAQAEAVLEEIVRIDAADVESLLALERIRRHRGDLAGAIEVLGRLRDADPRRAAQYLQQMAEHALALYRDDEALGYAAEAVERNPDDASAHRRLGDLYRSRQQMDRAIASYRRALELNERLYPVYFELAELHLARGETEDGDALYRRLLAITPDDDLVGRAARASIQINLGAGTLARLERDLLPLALGNPQRPIYRRVVVELYDAYATPLTAVAAREGEGAQEARATLRRLGGRAIKPLLEALSDPDPSQRRVALDILGELGNPSAAAPLLAAAENNSLEITQRLAALRAAGLLANPTLVPRLGEMATEGDLRLRGLAAWALVRIDSDDARDALTRVYGQGDDHPRAFAALGLGLAGRSEALREGLRAESDEDIRAATVWGLGRGGEAESVPLLLNELRRRAGAVSAEVAAEALGRIGGDAVTAALIEALFSPDVELREAAARTLRSSGAQADVSLVAPQPFERPRDYVARLVRTPEVQRGAVDLSPLRASIEVAASSALAGPVDQALAALSVLGSRPAGVGLGALTRGSAEWPSAVQDAANAELLRLGVSLVEPLVAAASHLDGAVRLGALRLLARIDHPRAAETVAHALADAPPSVRRAALESVGRSAHPPEPSLVPPMVSILRQDPDWAMRTLAAQALSRSPEAHSALREALAEDRYAFVREAAARALLEAPTEEDRLSLQRAARTDPEPQIRALLSRSAP